MLITVVELPEFIRQSKKLLSQSENSRLIFYLSTHPKDGILIQGTGGVRKIRWSREGSGKRGGVRVIYFYFNENMPLFLLTVFPKSEKTNLSKEERNELNKLTKILVNNYKKR
jgi:hypothetical protein